MWYVQFTFQRQYVTHGFNFFGPHVRNSLIQDVSKLNGKTSGMNSSDRRKKGYDNMGPKMYGYRVTELRSSDSYGIVAETTDRTLLLQDNLQETRLLHAVDDMDTDGVLLAVSRSSSAAHTSAVLTTLC
jgi:hypothetical protein